MGNEHLPTAALRCTEMDEIRKGLGGFTGKDVLPSLTSHREGTEMFVGGISYF